MQVKTFEAENMKTALEMVKAHLGPDAIILSAREHGGNFGLRGRRSVEVTAAVSDQKLVKKKTAEKKMTDRDRERFLASSARMQKQFIEKAFMSEEAPKEQKKTNEPASEPRAMTRRRYVDIADEEAVTSAAPEIESNSEPPKPMDNGRIAELEREVETLRALLARFESMPQTFVSGHPGVDFGLPFDLSSTFVKLTQAGLSEENTATFLRKAQKDLSPEQLKKPAIVQAYVARALLGQVEVVSDWLAGRVHILIGPAGQGKTSTLVKLASHLVLRERKTVAIMTTDTHKVGASEQLKIYAQILNVPFAEIRQPTDWNQLRSVMGSVHVVLVDTPSLLLRSREEWETFTRLLPPEDVRRRLHYVQSVTVKDREAFEIAERYRLAHFDDVIFTRLDEATQHGLIYNFQKHFHVPLHSFGIGPQIPEDIEVATRERVVDLIFRLSQPEKEFTP